MLAAIGLYGVIAYAAARRTREFGIRLALGAHPRQILGSVLKDGIVIATIGIAVGVLAGFALSRLAGRYVQELQLPGPLPLVASALVILAAAVSASLMPATRAATVDTIQALRAD